MAAAVTPAEPRSGPGTRTPGRAADTLELAPAKINLCLHVTGRRADGYHELDTLVAFAECGDRLRLSDDATAVSLLVSRRNPRGMDATSEAVVPTGTDNLVWRALAAAAGRVGGIDGLAVALDKHLPVGAGLGGGSSDAAALLRALDRRRLTTLSHDPGWTARLGADLPMCLQPQPWRARGIGDRLSPLILARDLPAVLVWPGRPAATPAVFAVRSGGFGAPVPEAALRLLRSDPITALARLRNDLDAAAMTVEPAIGRALRALEWFPACRLARMSGSGSALFGLFDRVGDAESAAERLRRSEPGWWVRATVIRAGPLDTRLTKAAELPALPAD